MISTYNNKGNIKGMNVDDVHFGEKFPKLGLFLPNCILKLIDLEMFESYPHSRFTEARGIHTSQN